MIERIFNLINERGITQKDLAQAIGVSTGNISDWKSGRAKPSIDVLNRIANYFGVSIDYLVGRTDVRNIDDLIEIAHIGVITWINDRAFSNDESSALRAHFYELLTRYKATVNELFKYVYSDSRKELLESGASLAELSTATAEKLKLQLMDMIRWIAVFPVSFNKADRPDESSSMELAKEIDLLLGLVSTDSGNEFSMTEDEIDLLRMFVSLDKDGKRILIGTATAQKQRMQAEQSEISTT
jgi:transcriptional regulator with XRE-family HTH domain